MDVLFEKKCWKYSDQSNQLRNNKKKLAKLQSIFWGEKGSFDNFTNYQIESSDFISPIIAYLKQTIYLDDNLLPKLIDVAPKNVAYAIRASEIIRNQENYSKHKIDRFTNSENIVSTTIQNLQKLNTIYTNLENSYNNSLTVLQKEDSLNILVWCSLKFVENQYRKVKHTGFDVDLSHYQSIIMVISKILNNINLSKYSRKSYIDDPSPILTDLLYRNTGILYREAPSNIPRQLEIGFPNYQEMKMHISKEFPNMKVFNKCFKTTLNLHNFIESIWDVYAFDFSTGIDKDHNELLLTHNPFLVKEWDRSNQKMQAEQIYWINLANIEIEKNNSFKNYRNNLSNDFMKTVYTSSMTGYFYLLNSYGLPPQVEVNGTKIELYKVLHFFNYFKFFFQEEYEIKFNESILQNYDIHWSLKLIDDLKCLSQQNKQRLATHTYKIDDFYNIFRDVITNRAEFDVMMDLFILEPSNNAEFCSHPFIKIDDSIVILSFIFSSLDVNRVVLQQVLKSQSKSVKKQETPRKKQVEEFEMFISGHFSQLGFTSTSGLELRNPSTNATLTDIDIIAYKDNHLFIIELKTTKLEITQKEISSHINSDLTKARTQLDTTLQFIDNFPEIFKKLLQKRGVLLPENFEIHTYIVDTTYEDDHKMFGKHLKLNLLELTTALSNQMVLLSAQSAIPSRFNELIKQGVMLDLNKMKNFTELSEDELIKMQNDMKRYNLYPCGEFTVDRFLEIINNQLVWSFLDEDYPLNKDTCQSTKINTTQLFK